MTSFTIAVQDREVLAALQALTRLVRNMAQVLQAIGDDITERTKRRFETSSGPDGAALGSQQQRHDGDLLPAPGRWLPQEGRFSEQKRGGRVAGKKPLFDTGELRRQIVPLVSGNVLTVTATPIYAAIHQFGGMAGHGHKVEIPARPFPPVTADGQLYPQGQALVLETLESFLTQDR